MILVQYQSAVLVLHGKLIIRVLSDLRRCLRKVCAQQRRRRLERGGGRLEFRGARGGGRRWKLRNSGTDERMIGNGIPMAMMALVVPSKRDPHDTRMSMRKPYGLEATCKKKLQPFLAWNPSAVLPQSGCAGKRLMCSFLAPPHPPDDDLRARLVRRRVPLRRPRQRVPLVVRRSSEGMKGGGTRRDGPEECH